MQLPLEFLAERNGLSMGFISGTNMNVTCRAYHYLGRSTFGNMMNFGFWSDDTYDGGLQVRSLECQLKNVNQAWNRRIGGDCLELARVALVPQAERRLQTSAYIAMVASYIRQRRDIFALYSYCDTNHHEGTLYRAANFIYIGHTGKSSAYVHEDGRVKHTRNKIKVKAKMLAEGFRVRPLPPKKIFVLPLNKKARRRALEIASDETVRKSLNLKM